MTHRDPAEYIEASYTRHPVDDIEPEQPEHSFSEDALLAIQYIAKEICEQEDPRWYFECFLLATGCGNIDMITMEQLAKRHGKTRAAVSKQCRVICEKHHIPPSHNMHQPATKQIYTLTNQCNNRNYCRKT